MARSACPVHGRTSTGIWQLMEPPPPPYAIPPDETGGSLDTATSGLDSSAAAAPVAVSPSSSSTQGAGSLWNSGFPKVATRSTTGPAAIRFPVTAPPITCPCAPARETVKGDLTTGAGEEEGEESLVGRKVPARESMSKRPWRVREVGWEAGWRRVTLVTAPEPLMMETPTRRCRAKPETHSSTSAPAASSSTTGRMADSLSRVITTGGLGLFFDPGGRPRGFLGADKVDPVAGESPFPPAAPPLAREMVRRGPSSSSESVALGVRERLMVADPSYSAMAPPGGDAATMPTEEREEGERVDFASTCRLYSKHPPDCKSVPFPFGCSGTLFLQVFLQRPTLLQKNSCPKPLRSIPRVIPSFPISVDRCKRHGSPS